MYAPPGVKTNHNEFPIPESQRAWTLGGPGELSLGEGWTALIEQGRIAFMREVGIDLPAEEARALMLGRMQALEEEELSDIVVIRSLADTEAHDMPAFMRRYLAHIFDGN